MLAISSSICRNVPPTSGMLRDMISAISVAGVIGYPAKSRTPRQWRLLKPLRFHGKEQ
jgi:hypothetical protein